MTYRDEGDALRARLETAEGELAAALTTLREQRLTYQDELLRLREAQPPAVSSWKSGVGMFGAGFLAMALLAAGWSSYCEAHARAQLFRLSAAPVAPSAIDAPAAEPHAAHARGASPHRPAVRETHQVEWEATVRSAVGRSVAPTTPCTLRATVILEDRDPQARGVSLDSVRCGDVQLYGAPGPRAEQGKLVVREPIVDPGTVVKSSAQRFDAEPPYRYAFTLRLQQEASAKARLPEVDIDSVHGLATLRQQGDDAFQVELELDTYGAIEPSQGHPLTARWRPL